MIWWAKRHRAGMLALVMAIYGVVLIVVGNRHVPLPRVADAATELLPIRLIAPLVLVIVLLWARGDFAIEKSAARPLWQYWDLMLALTVALSAAICAAVQQAGLMEDAWATQRNLLGFLGIGLAWTRFLSAEASAAALTAIVFAGMMLPRAPDGTLLPGAWPILDGGNGHSWLIAAALLVAGAVLSRFRTE